MPEVSSDLSERWLRVNGWTWHDERGGPSGWTHPDFAMNAVVTTRVAIERTMLADVARATVPAL